MVPANTPLSLYFILEDIKLSDGVSSTTCSTTTGKLTIKVCDEEFSTCGGKSNGKMVYFEPNTEDCNLDIDFERDSGVGGGNFQIIASKCKFKKKLLKVDLFDSYLSLLIRQSYISIHCHGN